MEEIDARALTRACLVKDDVIPLDLVDLILAYLFWSRVMRYSREDLMDLDCDGLPYMFIMDIKFGTPSTGGPVPYEGEIIVRRTDNGFDFTITNVGIPCDFRDGYMFKGAMLFAVGPNSYGARITFN